MRQFNRILLGGLVVGLVGWMGVNALAAEGDTEEGAIDPAAFEASLEGLTPEEQEAMRQAYQEVTAGEGIAGREFAGREGNVGAPTFTGGEVTGGLTGGETVGRNLTPQEQALMTQVETLWKELGSKGYTPEQIHQEIEARMGDQLREAGLDRGILTPGEKDEAVLRELYERGVPGMERGPGMERRGGGEFERGREGTGQTDGRALLEREVEKGWMTREEAEKYRSQMEQEHGGKEHGGGEQGEHWREEYDGREREINLPWSEGSSREMDRPTMEYERPTMEMDRPTMDYERPTMDYERPTYEHGGSTVQ